MIHDLELTTVIDMQGVLTQTFSQFDKNKLDNAEVEISIPLWQKLEKSFEEADYLSQKLAVINLMRKTNYPNLKSYITLLQDEL